MVTRDRFRHAMARFGAAVSVITTAGPAGRCGFTASAVCSLSDTPPTLLVCMNRGSEQNAAFQQNGVLCVNTLAAGQEMLSSLFAGQTGCAMEARFVGDWGTRSTGAPVFEEALIAFDCRIDRIVEAATHSIFICSVLDIASRDAAQGLVYFDRDYHPVGAAA
jgi:flavin reductase